MNSQIERDIETLLLEIEGKFSSRFHAAVLPKETAINEAGLKRGLYSSILKDSGRASSTGPAKVLEEFETYLKEPNSPFEEPCAGKEKNVQTGPLRPLVYWMRNVHRFPYLASITRDLFGIPASV